MENSITKPNTNPLIYKSLINSFDETGSSIEDNLTLRLTSIKSAELNYSEYILSMRLGLNVKKENFYVSAIQNLVKKNNFLQLSLEFSDENSDESQDLFENEILKNPNTYIIEFKRLESIEDLNIITDIVKKTNLEFSVNEVAEMFSIDKDSFSEFTKQY